jgi:hypothetical protein
VVANRAVEIPFTIDPRGVPTSYALFLNTSGPIVDGPFVADSQDPSPGAAAGPQPRSLEVVDLDPETTYHYRIAALQGIAEGTRVLGPEGTFTTGGPRPVPIAATGKRFRLRRRNVRVGRLTRRSKKLLVSVRGVPARCVLKLRLSVGGSKQLARKKANARGRAAFKLRFSKRIRKALHRKRVKLARVKLTARPPGQGASSVTIRKRLPKQRKRRH